jgi:hypothetical protein
VFSEFGQPEVGRAVLEEPDVKDENPLVKRGEKIEPTNSGEGNQR